jgi:hypothetical protein
LLGNEQKRNNAAIETTAKARPVVPLCMRERWPESRFEMKAGCLQMVGSRENAAN